MQETWHWCRILQCWKWCQDKQKTWLEEYYENPGYGRGTQLFLLTKDPLNFTDSTCLLSLRSAWWHCVQPHWPGAPTENRFAKSQAMLETSNEWSRSDDHITWIWRNHRCCFTECLVLSLGVWFGLICVSAPAFSGNVLWFHWFLAIIFKDFPQSDCICTGDDWSRGDVGGTFD